MAEAFFLQDTAPRDAPIPCVKLELFSAVTRVLFAISTILEPIEMMPSKPKQGITRFRGKI